MPRWVPALPTLCWILRVLELGLEASGTLGRPALSWRCCLENRKGLGILVRGDACIQLCEVCVAPAHLGRGETLLALAGLPGDSSARAWWGEGAGWGVCDPTSHTPLTERLTAGSSSGPWGIFICPKSRCSHCIAPAPPGFALQNQEVTCSARRGQQAQTNCTVLAVFPLSMNRSARPLPPPQTSPPAAARDLCYGFSMPHPTVPTKPPWVQERGGLVSSTGASRCWNVEDSG